MATPRADTGVAARSSEIIWRMSSSAARTRDRRTGTWGSTGWRGEGSGADGPESVVLGVLTVGELRVQREVSQPREQPIPDPYVDKLPSASAGGGYEHGPWAGVATGLVNHGHGTDRALRGTAR